MVLVPAAVRGQPGQGFELLASNVPSLQTQLVDVPTAAGGVTPLATLRVVDPHGPATGSDGSFSGDKAFPTVGDFLAAAALDLDGSKWVALCTKNDYSIVEPEVAWTDLNVGFTGTGDAEPSSFETQLPLLKPSSTGNLHLTLEKCSATVDAQTGGVIISAFNARLSVQGAGNANVNISGDGPDTCLFNTGLGAAPLSGLNATGCLIGGTAVGGSMVLTSCKVAGAITHGSVNAQAYLTNFDGNSLTFTGAPGVLTTDLHTLFTMGALVNGSIRLVDQPAQPAAVGIYGQYYVNAATTLATSKQTGTRDAPFATIQQAVDAIGTGAPGAQKYATIIIQQGNPAPGSQNFTVTTVTTYAFIAIISESGLDPVPFTNTGPMACGQLVVNDHAEVYLQGMHWEDTSAITARILGTNFSSGNGADDGGASFKVGCTFPHAPGSGDEHPSFGNLNFANIQMRGCDLAGNVTDTSNDGRNMLVEQCEVRGNVTSSFALLYIDRTSLVSARRNGKTVTSAVGGISILDAPNVGGVVFVVPALAAGMADVTVALSGARPGDTFGFAPNPAAILAGVAPVAAWSPAANQVTVRFFGTTAGGNYQVDFNIGANSGN